MTCLTASAPLQLNVTRVYGVNAAPIGGISHANDDGEAPFMLKLSTPRCAQPIFVLNASWASLATRTMQQGPHVPETLSSAEPEVSPYRRKFYDLREIGRVSVDV